MTSERDRAVEMLAAKNADEVGQVVLELADILNVPAMPSRLKMSTQIGKNDLCGPARADERGERMIPRTVVGRPVGEDQDPIGRRIIDTISQFLSVSCRIALEAGKTDFASRRRHGREIEHVFGLFDR